MIISHFNISTQQLIDIATDNDSSVVDITVSGDSVDISLKGKILIS